MEAPLPWKVVHTLTRYLVVDATGRTVGTENLYDDIEGSKERAQQIVVAMKVHAGLLAALKGLAKVCRELTDDSKGIEDAIWMEVDTAEAAIAKGELIEPIFQRQ